MLTKEEFLKKYLKPERCPLPEEDWADPLGYCWGYALTVDRGEVWDDEKHCPCELVKI